MAAHPAATQTLLALPPSSAPKGPARLSPKDGVKLALKELILRGAFGIQIEKRRMRKDKVTLLPGQAANLPETLAFFDLVLRRHTPNEIGEVIKGARKGHLEALPGEAESKPESAATVVAVAGALVLMVPTALAVVARLRRRLTRGGGHVRVASADTDFDVFDGVGDIFDSSFEGDLDSSVDSIDSALDSVADSIDSGVDAGVDSGAAGTAQAASWRNAP